MSWTYTLIMAAAVATGAILARGSQRGLGLSGMEKLGVGLGAFCGAMIGAKLPFALADWQGLASGWAWFSSGKTILFGLVGGYLGVELAKWALEIKVRTGDSFAVPVAGAVAVGRLACFSAGCCLGTATTVPWGVDFGDGIARHPTQLYESAFHAAAAVALWQFRRRGIFRGQLIKLYIIAYCVFRAMTEFIRPEPRLWLGLTGYQFAAATIIGLFAFLWYRDARAIAAEARAT